MTDMQILHKMLCRRVELLENAIDAARDLHRENGDHETHETMEKNIARFQEVRMILEEMKRIDPTCTLWET